MNIDDLLEECRTKDAFDIAEVEYAILETSGKVNVLMKSAHQPVTLEHMNLQSVYKGICTNVIIDGKILLGHLHSAKKDKVWLIAELKKQNINNYHNILLAYLDSANSLKCQLKNNKADTNNIL